MLLYFLKVTVSSKFLRAKMDANSNPYFVSKKQKIVSILLQIITFLDLSIAEISKNHEFFTAIEYFEQANTEMVNLADQILEVFPTLKIVLKIPTDIVSQTQTYTKALPNPKTDFFYIFLHMNYRAICTRDWSACRNSPSIPNLLKDSVPFLDADVIKVIETLSEFFTECHENLTTLILLISGKASLDVKNITQRLLLLRKDEEFAKYNSMGRTEYLNQANEIVNLINEPYYHSVLHEISTLTCQKIPLQNLLDTFLMTTYCVTSLYGVGFKYELPHQLKKLFNRMLELPMEIKNEALRAPMMVSCFLSEVSMQFPRYFLRLLNPFQNLKMTMPGNDYTSLKYSKIYLEIYLRTMLVVSLKERVTEIGKELFDFFNGSSRMDLFRTALLAHKILHRLNAVLSYAFETKTFLEEYFEVEDKIKYLNSVDFVVKKGIEAYNKTSMSYYCSKSSESIMSANEVTSSEANLKSAVALFKSALLILKKYPLAFEPNKDFPPYCAVTRVFEDKRVVINFKMPNFSVADKIAVEEFVSKHHKIPSHL